MKRPAEPGHGPEIQPQAKPAKPMTLRMSSIPIGITKDYLSKILERLEPIRTSAIEEFTQPGAKSRRGANIHSLSLAPAASHLDIDKFQVATVTFMKVPHELEECVSATGPGVAWLGDEGQEFMEVDVDSHFQGLTPLNYVSNPTVEYVVSSK